MLLCSHVCMHVVHTDKDTFVKVWTPPNAASAQLSRFNNRIELKSIFINIITRTEVVLLSLIDCVCVLM